MDQNIDRLTWTVIMLAIGISLYALCSPFFDSTASSLLNISDQTSIIVPGIGGDTDDGSGSGSSSSFTKNNDDSYLYNN